MRSRVRAAVLAAALVGQAAVALPASAANHLEVVATGLNNPRGLDVADDGTIHVAESGVGGDEFCTTIGEGEDAFELCFGPTAAVASIAPDGTVTRPIADLPSSALGEGEFVGVSDVSIAADGSLYLTMGLGGDAATRDDIAAAWAPAAMLGTLQHVVDGEPTEVLDMAAWEAENDPSAGQPSTEGPQGEPSNDSNPDAVLATADGLFAADAGGNTVLRVDAATGTVTDWALLEDRFVDAPPFLGLPPGTQMPMQAVPTSLTEAPDGDLVVGQLTGFPFPVGGANVYELDDALEVLGSQDGFTNVMDVAYLNGELYVLEIAHTSILNGFEGALVRVRADGTRIALLEGQLFAPGGLAVGPDGMLYITNGSVGAPGSGSVLRFDPSQAEDPAVQSACPPLEVAGTALTDVFSTTHEEAITCVLWHGLFAGFADGTFGPNAHITRGQIATNVARLIEAAGVALPEGSSGQFTDVAGTTHADAVQALAAAGIVSGFPDGTYRPNTRVTRAQAVTVIADAYAYMTGENLPDGSDAFVDDGGTHEPNINAAAAMGWVSGTGDATFSPNAHIGRGQMSSVLARVASDLVDGGLLTLPS